MYNNGGMHKVRKVRIFVPRKEAFFSPSQLLILRDGPLTITKEPTSTDESLLRCKKLSLVAKSEIEGVCQLSTF